MIQPVTIRFRIGNFDFIFIWC